jgi:hypothetical protein
VPGGTESLSFGLIARKTFEVGKQTHPFFFALDPFHWHTPQAPLAMSSSAWAMRRSNQANL